MLVLQYFVKGIAHSSYIISGNNYCAVVDPRRDVDIYIQAAKELDVTITHILETHLHADFLSGHIELAKLTGAEIYMPKSANCEFDHVPLKENDKFSMEKMTFQVLETPGHTPEHISYVVTDTARGNEPVGVFCGDTLFVGDVGRPDLFPGRAEELASKLYDSLHQKLLNLPDYCEVYPAHGAGSLCGRAMGAKRTSTIGYEKLYNPALNIKDRQEFIASLTTDMPPAPDHFSRCSKINAQGPQLLSRLSPLQPVNPDEFNRKSEQEGIVVLDIRDYQGFGGFHIPNAYSIDYGGNFATFAGWIIPPHADIIIVSHSEQQAHQAKRSMHRVGLDKVTGFLQGGMFNWARKGLPGKQVPQLSAAQVFKKISAGEKITLLDVRSPSEYSSMHIQGGINIPAPELRTRYKELDKSSPVLVMCSTGHRSSLGTSILQQHGYDNLYNAAGGIHGYSSAGYSKKCPVCFAPHSPHFMGE
ncbi:MAG: MBL fold metallo-hydrolase [bacterium]